MTMVAHVEFDNYIYRNDEEILITVYAIIYPEGGDGWNKPHYPSECEIDGVHPEIDLTKDEEERLEVQAFEEAQAMYEYHQELRAEAILERRRERALGLR